MLRYVTPVLIAGVLMGGAATADAHTQYTWKQVAHSYLHHRHQARRALGLNAVGRDIARDGVRVRLGAKKHHRVVVRKATKSQLARSTRTYKRWLAPPPAPVSVTDQPAPVSYAPPVQASSYTTHTTYSSGGQYPIPAYIVARESGGDYGAVNPSSGARGAYQFMPSTYYANCSTCDWSPADQDRTAAKVWAETGGSAWSTGG